jgi:D-glycero-D-manno-heptose 1,7-bisphosphate phosphatase
MTRAIFLDRDGVLNRAIVRDGKPYPATSLKETEILPGVVRALELLKAAGFLLIVVTNQPDVARGTLTVGQVEEINTLLASSLPIDEFRTCYHDTIDQCACRKPRPGALVDASQKHAIDLAQSYMVGDRWRDTDAGRAAGCRVIWIDNGYSETKPASYDYRVSSLLEGALIVLAEARSVPYADQ